MLDSTRLRFLAGSSIAFAVLLCDRDARSIRFVGVRGLEGSSAVVARGDVVAAAGVGWLCRWCWRAWSGKRAGGVSRGGGTWTSLLAGSSRPNRDGARHEVTHGCASAATALGRWCGAWRSRQEMKWTGPRAVLLAHAAPSKLAHELSASAVLPKGKLPEISTYLRRGQRRGTVSAVPREMHPGLEALPASRCRVGAQKRVRRVAWGGAAHVVIPVAHRSAAYEYVLPSNTSGEE
jgi:hypothetical protein